MAYFPYELKIPTMKNKNTFRRDRKIENIMAHAYSIYKKMTGFYLIRHNRNSSNFSGDWT